MQENLQPNLEGNEPTENEEQEAKPTQEELNSFREYLEQAKEYVDCSMAEFIQKCSELVSNKRKVNDVKTLLIGNKSYLQSYIEQIKAYLATPVDFATMGATPEAVQAESDSRQKHFDNIIGCNVLIERIQERFAVLDIIETGHSFVSNLKKEGN